MKTLESKNQKSKGKRNHRTRLLKTYLKVLLSIQKAARYLCPFLYPGSLAPECKTICNTNTQVRETENFKHTVTQKETFNYDPSSPDRFSSVLNEKEEVHEYPMLGIKLISKVTTLFIQMPEAEILIEMEEQHTGSDIEPLTQVSGNISFHIHLLNN